MKKRRTSLSALYLFVIATNAAILSAQTPPKIDSTKTAINDSTRIASRPPAQSNQANSGVDAPVNYDARKIEHLIDQKITVLTGGAIVKYKTVTLEAGRITVDWDKNLLMAETLPDSLKSESVDSTNSANGRSDKSDYPTLIERSDRMSGEKMEYNFASEKGRVLRGRTEFDGGSYRGAHIKRVESDELNISHGIYSTCENDDPHFHFWSRKMKVKLGDKVVAKPIVFYFGKVPLAVFPFAMFPLRTGRHSGLLIPRFGTTSLEGRYLRDLGYYWAINDYLDARFTVDFFERSGWFARSTWNYAKRYSYNGSISGSITRKNFSLTEQQDRFWDLAISHNQTISPNSSLRISGNFVNNNSFYREVSDNRDQQLTRRLQSRATYSTRFGGGRNSLTINLSDTKDLEDGSFQRTLPAINLSFGQRRLFGSNERNRSSQSTFSSTSDVPWYHNIYYNLSSRAEYRVSQSAAELASTESLAKASHSLNLSFSSPKRIFGWLSYSSAFSLSEDWFDRATDYFLVGQSGLEGPLSSITFDEERIGEYDLENRGIGSSDIYLVPDDFSSEIGTREQKGFAARHIFNYSASANTKAYGFFQPKIGSLQALRHVVSPSISFSYRPDFSDPKWGYYEELTLPDGTKVLRDRFGGTSRGEIAGLSFSVGNLFQMKYGDEEKPKKIDLFTLNFSSGYNFAADSFKLADLSTSFQANPARNVSVSMGVGHTFYDYNDSTGFRENRYLFSGKNFFRFGFMRLTRFRFDANVRLQGKGAGGDSGSPTPAPVESGLNDFGDDEFGRLPQTVDRFSPQQRFADTSIPWSANFALSMSFERSNPLNTSKRAHLSLRNAEIRLTPKWRVGVSGQFDLVKKSIVDQRYTLYRDLHCWEMQMYWTPTGFRKGFYLRISIKAPHLRDIKIEKRGGRTSVFGGSYY